MKEDNIILTLEPTGLTDGDVIELAMMASIADSAKSNSYGASANAQEAERVAGIAAATKDTDAETESVLNGMKAASAVAENSHGQCQTVKYVYVQNGGNRLTNVLLIACVIMLFIMLIKD